MSEVKEEPFKFETVNEVSMKELSKRLASIDKKNRNDIIDTFAKSMKQIVLMAKKACKKEEETVELDRVRRILNLLPNDNLFLFCQGKIWVLREPIKKRDADFFLKAKFDIHEDEDQDLILALIELVRDNYNRLSKADQDAYWRHIFNLLDCVDRFVNYKPFVENKK